MFPIPKDDILAWCAMNDITMPNADKVTGHVPENIGTLQKDYKQYARKAIAEYIMCNSDHYQDPQIGERHPLLISMNISDSRMIIAYANIEVIAYANIEVIDVVEKDDG